MSEATFYKPEPKLVCAKDDDGYNTDTPLSEESVIYVNLYVTNRHYGGPEEGGWWYDVDYCVLTLPTLNTIANIKALYDACEQHAIREELFFGDINSVRGGQEAFCRAEASPCESNTSGKPDYE